MSNGKTIMLKISLTDTRTQRRLIIEGKLIAPWVAELRSVWTRVKAELNGRELVIDMGNVITVSQEAENTLLEMMDEGATFRCRGVLTKHVVQQLARRGKKNASELGEPALPNVGEEKGKQ
jgi:hypothetical protein